MKIKKKSAKNNLRARQDTIAAELFAYSTFELIESRMSRKDMPSFDDRFLYWDILNGLIKEKRAKYKRNKTIRDKQEKKNEAKKEIN